MDNREEFVINLMTLEELESIKDILVDDYDEFWSESVLKSEIENPNAKFFSLKKSNYLLTYFYYIFLFPYYHLFELMKIVHYFQ